MQIKKFMGSTGPGQISFTLNDQNFNLECYERTNIGLYVESIDQINWITGVTTRTVGKRQFLCFQSGGYEVIMPLADKVSESCLTEFEDTFMSKLMADNVAGDNILAWMDDVGLKPIDPDKYGFDKETITEMDDDAIYSINIGVMKLCCPDMDDSYSYLTYYKFYDSIDVLEIENIGGDLDGVAFRIAPYTSIFIRTHWEDRE